ncbi:MAG: glycosyl transferase family 2, partial [Chitinophagaceae bacterium]
VLLHTWWFAVSTMGLRLLIQAVILFKCMKKLNEKDLWPFFLFYDIWMCIYYLLVLPSLWKAPQKNSW